MADHLEISQCPICAGLPTALGITVGYSVAALRGRVSIDYACCPACGFVFQRNPLTWESLRGYYRQSPRYRPAEIDESEAQLCLAQANFMADAGPLDGRSILDVGADMGKLLDVLAAKHACKTAYMEENEEAKRQLRSHGRHREVVGLRESDCFDWLVLSEVLEHIVDPVTYLSMMRRYLAADGKVFIEVPCHSFWDDEDYGFSFEHVNYFSPASLTSALHRASFVTTKLEIGSDARYFVGKVRVIRAVAQAASPSLPAHLAAAVRAHHNRGMEARFAAAERLSIDNARNGRPGLALYGAAELADLLLSNTTLDAADILAIFDTDPKKHNTLFHGLPVRPPQDIPVVSPTAILILSSAESAIRRTISATGFTGEVIGWSDIKPGASASAGAVPATRHPKVFTT